MSTTLDEPTVAEPTLAPTPSRRTVRPLRKRVMHWLRRTHLYLGLLLFPWAILYGVTAFLFNHPTAFPDQPTFTFSRAAVADTPLDNLPSPREQAETIVAALNAKQKPKTPYQLGAGDALYATRDFIFATVQADGRTFSILYDVKSSSGTIRETTAPQPAEKAPFATGKPPASRSRNVGLGMGMTMTMGGSANRGDGLKIEGGLTDRFKAAVPTLLERNGLPAGEVTLSSAPDLKFPVEAEGKTWTATYSPLSRSVTGSLSEATESDLSVRRFLLRMHLAHGYPAETSARWFWAVVVDTMAFTMCFWGLSGLLMWWQIKATRRGGLLLLLLSLAAATALGLSMHSFLSQ